MNKVGLKIFCSALLLVTTSSLYAQDHSPVISDRLAILQSKFQLPGIVASFEKQDEIQAGAAGIRRLHHEAPISITDKLHLGSITKSMTALLVATFIEDGQLQWDSTLEHVFPQLEIHPKLKSVTIEMLAAHRAGLDKGLTRLADEIDAAMAHIGADDTDWPKQRGIILGVVLKNSPELEPAIAYSYSNVGYLLLGHILEVISGKSWEMLIQERLFSPLNLECGFGSPVNPQAAIPDQPWGHWLDQDSKLQSIATDNSPIWGPAGTVHCNLKSVHRYLSMQMDGFNGKPGIVKVETFTKLHTPYPEQSYTYGGLIRLERNWAGGTVFTHSGTNLKNMAYIWLAPKKDTSYFGFVNMGGDKAADAIDEAIGFMIGLQNK